jgi:hypothetical protein
MRKRSLVVSTLIGFMTLAFANAATFSVVEKRVLKEDDFGSNPICNVRLSGEIVTGDAAKIVDALKALAVEISGKEFVEGFTICLNSPGGSYPEGLEIARAVLDNHIATLIEARADCYSACALVFMAGNFQFEGSLGHRRRLNMLGRLGFHAPYLLHPPEKNDSQTDLAGTYEEGVRAIGRLLKLGLDHKIDLLPPGVLADMLEKGPDELFMIDTVFKAIKADIPLYSDSAVSPKITQAALCNVCQNIFADQRMYDIDTPPTKCDAKEVRKQKDQFWFGPYGAEGEAWCAAIVPGTLGAHYGVYTELIGTGQKVTFEPYRFTSTWYYLLPPTSRVGY